MSEQEAAQKTIYDYDWKQIESMAPPEWLTGAKWWLAVLATATVASVAGAVVLVVAGVPAWLALCWPGALAGVFLWRLRAAWHRLWADGYDLALEGSVRNARLRVWPAWPLWRLDALAVAGIGTFTAAMLTGATLDPAFLLLLGPAVALMVVGGMGADTVRARGIIMREHPDRLPPLLVSE